MADESVLLSAILEQRVFPPYDALHGTPHAMLWRRVTFQTLRGGAALEQTDYGHPGRLNPWEPRNVSPSLQNHLPQLEAIAEAMVAVA